MTDHPITPPTELVQQWKRTAPHQSNEHEHYHYITLCAAEWGADEELVSCCKCIYDQGWFANPEHRIAQLRAARRPKHKTRAEIALEQYDRCVSILKEKGYSPAHCIRDALVYLKQLEESND